MDIVSWTLGNEAYPQDKPVYIDPSNPSRSLSAADVRTEVRQLVAGFRHHGIQKSDAVCVVSFNDIHYTSLFLGAIGSGGCFTGANPGYTAHELSHHIRITQARFLLTSLKTLDVALAAARTCGIPASRVFVLNLHGEDIPAGQQSWHALLACGEEDWVEVDDPDSTPAAYVSTSGTSGLPKAAVLPHSYMVSQGKYQMMSSDVQYDVSTLIAIPPFHVFTIPVQHALPLRKGAPTYIMPRFEVEGFLGHVESFKIAHIMVVPPLLMTLAQASVTTQLGSIRRIYVGGSCATDGMQQQLYAKLPPQASIEQVYGMTEVGWATAWHDDEHESTGSVGRPLPGTQLRLVDREGRVVTEEGVNGEIHISPPHPMLGYLNNPTATEEAIAPDGWVRTGDVGYLRDGRWYVVDRTKDLIKVRGWQVSPVEIEAALLEHPQVTDAGVIGVSARNGTGEIPVAYVVRSEPGLDEDAVKSFLGEKLARYKGVEEVIFIDSIPRNPTGKILRRVLRDSRGTQPLTSNQAAESAYSSAIKSLDKYQQEREREAQLDGSSSPSPSSSGGRKRAQSLTDASTISLDEPSTPPAEILVVVTKRGSKRKGGALDEAPAKRRSARVAAIHIRL